MPRRTRKQNDSNLFAIDFDYDGDIDILGCSSEGSGTGLCKWYENDGSESFTESNIIDPGTRTRQFYVIDLDKDGDLDLILSQSNVNKVVWFENDGSMSFSTNDNSFASLLLLIVFFNSAIKYFPLLSHLYISEFRRPSIKSLLSIGYATVDSLQISTLLIINS